MGFFSGSSKFWMNHPKGHSAACRAGYLDGLLTSPNDYDLSKLGRSSVVK